LGSNSCEKEEREPFTEALDTPIGDRTDTVNILSENTGGDELDIFEGKEWPLIFCKLGGFNRMGSRITWAEKDIRAIHRRKLVFYLNALREDECNSKGRVGGLPAEKRGQGRKVGAWRRGDDMLCFYEPRPNQVSHRGVVTTRNIWGGSKHKRKLEVLWGGKLSPTPIMWNRRG